MHGHVSHPACIDRARPGQCVPTLDTGSGACRPRSRPCTREETVLDPRTGEVLGHAPALSDDMLYPKERALVDLARRERARTRRLLCFATRTGTRDVTPRIRSVLEGAGLRVAVLKAETVAADRREEWVAARVREGVDVLLTNPRLVQAGLDYEESDAASRGRGNVTDRVLHAST